MSRLKHVGTSILRWTGLAVLLAVGAVALTWPLADQLGSGLPLGTETVATVPLFNLWTLAWNVESAKRGFAGYFQAPIFHPTADAFALSEPQPLTGFLAFALNTLGIPILAAYNILLLAALTFNGLLAVAVARLAGLMWLPAVAAGALVLVLPFSHQELGVLQLVPLAGVLLFAMAVLAFERHPGLLRGLFLGLALATAYGLSAQVAVFAALSALSGVVFLWWPHWRSLKAWGGLAAGATLFLLLVSPMLAAQWRATESEGRERSIKTVRQQSAQPVHFFTSAWPQMIQIPGITTAERPSARAFWPGGLRLLLGCCAFAYACWRRPPWRRLALAGALVTAGSVLLALGANAQISDYSVAGVLRHLPGLSQTRSFFRFALFFQLALSALAVLALQAGLDRMSHGRLARRGPWIVGLLALFAVVEIRPIMGEIQPLPPLELELPWVTWLERHAAPDDVLAFVPFPEGRSSRDYLGTSQWMYWQIRHWRPMVNGYSGFFPTHFRRLKESLKSFPSVATLRALKAAGVRYCIVHRAVIESSPPPDASAAIQLRPVFRDEEHGLAIFELRDSAPPS